MNKIQIIETAVAALLYLVLRFFISNNIDKFVAKNTSTKTRSKIVKKVINLTLLLVFITIIFSIYGVNQSELAIFIGSLLTIIGVAFFAQWSILSNITSGIIIFFSHPVKLDDTISIIDKDYEVVGRISDIGLFFIILKTKEDEQITIPNSIFLQKMIKKKANT
jgi:small-conductance mechanosensitive channel